MKNDFVVIIIFFLGVVFYSFFHEIEYKGVVYACSDSLLMLCCFLLFKIFSIQCVSVTNNNMLCIFYDKTIPFMVSLSFPFALEVTSFELKNLYSMHFLIALIAFSSLFEMIGFSYKLKQLLLEIDISPYVLNYPPQKFSDLALPAFTLHISYLIIVI